MWDYFESAAWWLCKFARTCIHILPMLRVKVWHHHDNRFGSLVYGGKYAGINLNCVSLFSCNAYAFTANYICVHIIYNYLIN